MKTLLRLLTSLIVLSLLSCGSHKSSSSKKINFDSLKDPLIEANKKYVKQESDEIDQYVKFKQWDMVKSGTGARYMIYKHGSGDSVKTGQRVSMNYKVSLLNGTLCYSSEKTGPRQFVIGQDNVESGLHEALTYLRVGDKAIIILPSHLAFGLTGDGNKIPPRSSVLYDVELLSVQ